MPVRIHATASKSPVRPRFRRKHGHGHAMERSLTLTAVLACLIVPLELHSQEAMQGGNEESWLIGPRVGVSPFTGNVGIELQRKRFSLSWGGSINSESLGLRYYPNPLTHSWYIGAFYWNYVREWEWKLAGSGYTLSALRLPFRREWRLHRSTEYPSPRDWFPNDVDETHRIVGLGAGRRWHWQSGSDVLLGVSVAYDSVEFSDVGGVLRRASAVLLILELSLGFSL